MCLVIWATGLMPQPLTESLSIKKSKSGRIMVDDYLKPETVNNNVYCIGDCSELPLSLPPTAQVANQQGKYLAKKFNSLLTRPYDEFEQAYAAYDTTFGYKFKGTMAYIGAWKGVISLPHHMDKGAGYFKKAVTRLQGYRAWLLWRSAYFTMLTSTVNRILIPMYWFKAWIFGRDFTRF